MAALILSMSDYNFRWPGKVQSLIYRIYNYRDGELVGTRLTGIHPRFKDMISVWSSSLFADGTFNNFRIDFDDFVLHTSEIGKMITLNLETVRRDFYVIRINLGKDIHSCCDVHSVNENWRIKGVDMFNINYVEHSMNVNDYHGSNVPTHLDIQIDPGFSGANIFPKTEEKKESKEFADLKSKISEMASVVREQDKK